MGRKKKADFKPDTLPEDPAAWPDWIAANVFIQDKAGNTVPLLFNKAQRKLWAVCCELIRAGKPVRVIILKARQLGFSTAIQGIFYMLACHLANRMGMVIAHDDDSTDMLFGKARFMQEENPKPPPTRYSNRKELVFDTPLRSKLTMQTAGKGGGKGEVGRSITVQSLHLSELAFYADAGRVLTSALQAVPNEPMTMIFIESTANGIGNEFHKRWNSAYNKEPGCEWAAIFFAWWEEDKYRKEIPEGTVVKWTEKEEVLRKQYALDDRQLYWRRWAISNLFNGDEALFNQEYPGCPEDAFLASGRPSFNQQLLKQMWDAATDPPRKGYLVVDGKTVRFVESENGHLCVYREPHPLGQYSMGTDVSEGNGGDDAGTVVIHKRTYLDVAVLCSDRISPEELAEETDKLRRWYNNAIDVPDVTQLGQAFLQEYKKKTGRIYHQQVRDETTDRWRDELGYKISSQSARALLIQQFRGALHGGYIRRINHRRTIEQLQSFVKHSDGKEHAAEGCKDDLPFMYMLAIQGVMQEPWRPPRQKQELPRRGASVPGSMTAERAYAHG